MAGTKRRSEDGGIAVDARKEVSKRLRTTAMTTTTRTTRRTTKTAAATDKTAKVKKSSEVQKPRQARLPTPVSEDDFVGDDDGDDYPANDEFDDFSDSEGDVEAEDGEGGHDDGKSESKKNMGKAGGKSLAHGGGGASDQKSGGKADSFLNGSSSREAHAKQKALAQDRKAAKRNADLIGQSKKLWERLRRKSHVPKEERDRLVKDLFEIITGRVKDFVFKHDSVRVIQCALKYATPKQRHQIARELKGEYRALAESKYAKFLIAKLVVGDDEIRDMIVPEFYGHVKRLIRHPEASWIVDDIYRTIATHEQKANLLREWYGPEFVIFKALNTSDVNADLATILEQHPEKRGPIMQNLKELTNQLVQKKTTGFTMLHDALLQYFLNCKVGGPEATEFLEMLKDDEEGDCYKNLAFTKSGSRLVCLALAYGNSKDRRTILKFFKTHIKLLAGDANGHLVLLTAYDVIDDTVMSAKAIFPELLVKDLAQEQREQELLRQVEHLTARIPLLYLMASEPPKWLFPENDIKIINEVHAIRTTTSKKETEIRRAELVKAMSQPLLDLISSQAQSLIQSSFGCQFMTEVIFGAIGEKQEALNAIASLAKSDPSAALLNTPHAGRLIKALVQGGRFDQKTKSIKVSEPPLDFHNILHEQIADKFESMIVAWSLSFNSFIVVAMLEAPGFKHGAETLDILSKHSQELTDALGGAVSDKDKVHRERGNAGARIILEKIQSGKNSLRGNMP